MRLADITSKTGAWWQGIRKPVITGFVIFHLTALGGWLLVPGWRHATYAIPFAFFTNFLGIYPDFAVFGDDPRTEYSVEAIVKFEDGHTALFSFPEPEKLSLFNRMIKWRFRKWESTYLANPQMSRILPDAARYVSYCVSDDHNNPVEIVLTKRIHHLELDKNGAARPDEHLPIYIYKVTQGDLK